MKTFLIFALTAISMVCGQDVFRFPTNKTVPACILAKFSADFSLSFTDGNVTRSATGKLPPAKNIAVDGSCAIGDEPHTLMLMFDDTVLSFTISDEGEMVTAELQYVLQNPNKTFGVNYTAPVNMIGGGKEFPNMGGSNNSYLCKAPEEIMLASNQSEDVRAEANITFTDLQIQAFGVKNANFSNTFECSADKSSTTAVTTIATSTLAPPTGVGNYTLKSDNVTCLRLEANISIIVHYLDKKGEMMNRTVMVPSDAEVSGICGDMMTDLTLTFSDKAEMESNGTLTITFSKKQDYSLISSVEFDLDFTDSNKTISGTGDVDDVLALSKYFYTCTDESFMLGKDEVALQDLKVQAFDLTDGDFSSKGLDCDAKAPAGPTTGNYTVKNGNVTCISLSAALTLEIIYLTTENKNETVKIYFEKDGPTGGQCSNVNETSENIIVEYNKDNFFVEFVFVKVDKVSANTNTNSDGFFVQNITVQYTLLPKFFPKVKDEGAVRMGSKTNQKLFQTGSDKFYKCSASTTTNIDPSVSLITKNLRMSAFHKGAALPNLDGTNADECSADNETNSIVPIAVGAALAGLVVIVLIAYLIGRRRNKKGYESV